MEGIDLSQDPDMALVPDITLDRDIMDMIKTIDQDMTDLNLLEEEENWIGMIDCEPIEYLHILCDA